MCEFTLPKELLKLSHQYMDLHHTQFGECVFYMPMRNGNWIEVFFEVSKTIDVGAHQYTREWREYFYGCVQSTANSDNMHALRRHALIYTNLTGAASKVTSTVTPKVLITEGQIKSVVNNIGLLAMGGKVDDSIKLATGAFFTNLFCDGYIRHGDTISTVKAEVQRHHSAILPVRIGNVLKVPKPEPKVIVTKNEKEAA